MYKVVKRLISATALSFLLFTSAAASTDRNAHYEVTITNLTYSINLTPILVASHYSGVSILKLGAPASEALTPLAEGGATAPLTELLHRNSKVVDVQTSGGLLAPGESVTVVVRAKKNANRISIASMMLPTNDGFVALNSAYAPKHGHGSATFYSPGYDAGTEPNDEMCANIPGPTCGGAGPSPDVDGEGFVHIHRGIHGIADLAADKYDWRNPVVKVKVKRIPARH